MTTILDTNVASELSRERPNPVVMDWWNRQVSEEMFVTAVTEAEMLFGIAIMPVGRQRSRQALRNDYVLRVLFANRILPFDSAAAQAYAVISSHRRRIGRRIEHPDAQIAAIARSHNMAVATRNISDFTDCGIELINPWSTEGTD